MGVSAAWADPATPDAAVLRRLGEQVRDARQALGWSQERLADECGLHWSYIGQIELGKRNVGLLNVVRVARALDISPAALLEGL